MSDMEMSDAPVEEAGASSQHQTPQKRPGEEGGGEGAKPKKRSGKIKDARGAGSTKGVTWGPCFARIGAIGPHTDEIKK